MKKAVLIFTLMIGASAALAQSKSYETLRHRFGDEEGVHSFSLGGIFLKAAMGIIASDDDLLKKSMRHVKHCRFIVIPNEAFVKEGSP